MTQVEYSRVENKSDIININRFIKREISEASSRPKIVQLVRRSRYLITLTYSPAWKKALGSKINAIRRTATRQFTKTAMFANKKIKKYGLGDALDSQYG